MSRFDRSCATGRVGAGTLASALVVALALALLCGCSASLLPKPTPVPALFALDDDAPAAPPPPNAAASAPTLIVTLPRAAAGFDTRQIVYLRQPRAFETFALSEWIDTPAQMLAPLMVRALQRSDAFHAVVRGPGAAAGELRLDTELIRLQQEFIERPSRVRLTLRAVLTDTATRRVVAWREFDAGVSAASDDSAGGVAAAQAAVQRVLAELALFCADVARRR